jgi:hypothetical protein
MYVQYFTVCKKGGRGHHYVSLPPIYPYIFIFISAPESNGKFAERKVFSFQLIFSELAGPIRRGEGGSNQ